MSSHSNIKHLSLQPRPDSASSSASLLQAPDDSPKTDFCSASMPPADSFWPSRSHPNCSKSTFPPLCWALWIISIFLTFSVSVFPLSDFVDDDTIAFSSSATFLEGRCQFWTASPRLLCTASEENCNSTGKTRQDPAVGSGARPTPDLLLAVFAQGATWTHTLHFLDWFSETEIGFQDADGLSF